MRLHSRITQRTIAVARACVPSRLKNLLRLIRPHVYSIYRDPSLFKVKLYYLRVAWNTGGLEEVIRRLRLSTGNKDILTAQPDSTATVEKFMLQLADSSVPREPVRRASKGKVTVIIPVYRGVAETARCIQSVINSANLTSYEFIIINDASPEVEVDEYLSTLEGQYPNVQILRNQENLGFVKTVNRGMRLASDADVILLNSDTIVANNWLDRLTTQAYADTRIGTVTPFSNNATICSYPDLVGWSSLPPDEDTAQLDLRFAAANAGQAAEIPTAVGFCMYIKRSCLSDVGLFDEEAFGKGYGEENDFCLRALNKGWKHILAADIFVFHEGEVSFSASASSKKAHATDVIRKRHPNYEAMVASHIAQNPAYSYRIAATAARYRLDDRPVILFISHMHGGGTEKHVQELARTASEKNTRVLYLRPQNTSYGTSVTLEAHNEADKLKLELASGSLELLARVLNAFGVTKVHIHHAVGFSFPVESLVALMNVPYDVTVHDLHPICPRITMFVPKAGYCGVPTVSDCNACLSNHPKIPGGIEIVWWRAQFSSLLNGANNVYCPSRDTAQRILEHYPSARVVVIPHEVLVVPQARYSLTPRTRRRFAILGVLAEHKGLSLIQEALKNVQKHNFPIEFVLIGYAERSLPKSNYFSQTGPYTDNDLPSLIDQFDPDALIFPAQCPETYSYTLSAAIRTGLPIIVSDLGALPERVKDLANGHVFPHSFSGAELAEYLTSIELRPIGKNDDNKEMP